MSIYDLSFREANGELKDFSAFKNRVLLLVNIATECGFAPQIKDLQELHEKYSDQGLTIIAFPCNNFGNQQPGTESEIKYICENTYGVKFIVASRTGISLEYQDTMSPIYKYLQETLAFEVPWNFTKFIIGPDESIEYRLPDFPVADLSEIIERNIQKINLEKA
jgi:glutathione peroxidase